MEPPAPDPTADPLASHADASSAAARLKEIARLFTRLGFTAFGGPAVHIALMEDEVVTRRRWLDRQHFLDLIAALNFIPGPNSTEMAMSLGLLRGGLTGLVAAGVCFITPAVLIILPIAWAYVRFGRVAEVRGALQGVSAAVVAVVAVAGIRFARTAIRDRFTLIVMLLAGGGEVFLRYVPAGQRSAAALPGSLQAEIVVLAAAAAAGAIRSWPFSAGATAPTLALAATALGPASPRPLLSPRLSRRALGPAWGASACSFSKWVRRCSGAGMS